MKCNITKWGNSYAVRLPKNIIDEFGWYENHTLELETKGKSLILKPGKKQILKELLKNVQPQKEIEWGNSRGKEFW